ncbi:hypothetical protein DFR70_11550 [Nocardia tenerifensis]|uniref:Uncharacterized protein n=1 Tax=Nocardia tenerifensis TaxID=228006 RepID=A0A318KEV6_9NOCA|nr:hypothetical protein [Nocardia tenerifensis]PXX58077.1 hypothetical protein DFR70_11550 [Nocardia tenerifensis]
MPDLATPTQVAYPWQATARTVFAVLVALASLIPVVAVAGGIDTVPAVAQLIAVCGAVTRILALPAVEDFLSRFLPFLAAGH